MRKFARAVSENAELRGLAEEELRRRSGFEAGPSTEESGDAGASREARESQVDGMDPADFPAAREQGGSIDTIMTQQTVPLDEAREVLNRSEQRREGGQQVHAICPMVIPRGRSFLSMLPVLLLLVLGVVGSAVVAAAGGGVFAHPLFGIHYWVLSVAAVAFVWWRQGMVMVPDGCQALITHSGSWSRWSVRAG
nr:hypothetical protein [Streptomyces sp. NEAU-S7GS2]